MRITKSEISMRTWRSPMSAASQGAFVVIPEISHSDISGIATKAPCEAALMGARHECIEISDFVMRTFVQKCKETNRERRLHVRYLWCGFGGRRRETSLYVGLRFWAKLPIYRLTA